MNDALNRRSLLRAGSLVLLLGAQQIARGASVVAVRIWPAEDYTRVTIESDGALQARISSPSRAKSADRIDGAILTMSAPVRYRQRVMPLWNRFRHMPDCWQTHAQ